MNPSRAAEQQADGMHTDVFTEDTRSSQGGAEAYAFLCQGSMYSRPRWSKMSFSVVAARNSFWSESTNKQSVTDFSRADPQILNVRLLHS